MNIRNVANQGGVERTSDRNKRSDGLRTVIIPSVGRDEASISKASREAAAAIVGLADRARGNGRDRDEIVQAAKAKLAAGQLDSRDAMGVTAQRLLDAKFFSA
jgi:hypothetical protein